MSVRVKAKTLTHTHKRKQIEGKRKGVGVGEVMSGDTDQHKKTKEGISEIRK